MRALRVWESKILFSSSAMLAPIVVLHETSQPTSLPSTKMTPTAATTKVTQPPPITATTTTPPSYILKGDDSDEVGNPDDESVEYSGDREIHYCKLLLLKYSNTMDRGKTILSTIL